MKRMTFLTSCGILATVALTMLAPLSAMADSRQNTKNQWRNLGVLGAAVAGYGLLSHNSTATILGAAGAAYSANRYEQDRKSQSQANANRHRDWYYRSNNNNNGYYNNNGNNGYYGNTGSYDNNSNYNGSYDNQQGNNDDRNHDENGQKHHGKGWYKNHGDDHEGDNNR